MIPTGVANRVSPGYCPVMAVTLLTRSETVVIPPEIGTLSGFRAWARSDPALEHATVWFICGNVWVDYRPMQLFAEASVRVAIISELHALVRRSGGKVFGRGVFWTHPQTETAGNPDGLFISHESFAAKRIRFLPDPPRDCDEIEGVPDIVLEIAKTGEEAPPLREAYFEAGIQEYWLVDARGSEVEFTIYKHSGKKYTATRAQAGGWQKSGVFGKSFRITRVTDATGNPEFTLEVR